MTSRILRADEKAARAYAEKLRSESSTGTEQLPPKEKAAGSSPVQSTTIKKVTPKKK